MAEPSDPLDVAQTTPAAQAEAPASRVGPRSDGEPEPLPGTETMGSETGGLAGTCR